MARGLRTHGLPRAHLCGTSVRVDTSHESIVYVATGFKVDFLDYTLGGVAGPDVRGRRTADW